MSNDVFDCQKWRYITHWITKDVPDDEEIHSSLKPKRGSLYQLLGQKEQEKAHSQNGTSREGSSNEDLVQEFLFLT